MHYKFTFHKIAALFTPQFEPNSDFVLEVTYNAIFYDAMKYKTQNFISRPFTICKCGDPSCSVMARGRSGFLRPGQWRREIRLIFLCTVARLFWGEFLF